MEVLCGSAVRAGEALSAFQLRKGLPVTARVKGHLHVGNLLENEKRKEDTWGEKRQVALGTRLEEELMLLWAPGALVTGTVPEQAASTERQMVESLGLGRRKGLRLGSQPWGQCWAVGPGSAGVRPAAVWPGGAVR